MKVDSRVPNLINERLIYACRFDSIRPTVEIVIKASAIVHIYHSRNEIPLYSSFPPGFPGFAQEVARSAGGVL